MNIEDDRNRPGYPREERRGNGALWFGVAAIAIVAAVALFSATRPTTEDGRIASDLEASQMQEITPAEGDSFTNQSTTTTNAAPTEATPAPTPVPAAPAPVPAPATPTADAVPPSTEPLPETPAAGVAPAAIPPSYATEEDCKAATSVPCHYVTCDSVPEGKQPDEACGADFKKGWQPLAATPDKTSVPEQINPPLTGQGNADTTNPPLTGQ